MEFTCQLWSRARAAADIQHQPFTVSQPVSAGWQPEQPGAVLLAASFSSCVEDNLAALLQNLASAQLRPAAEETTKLGEGSDGKNTVFFQCVLTRVRIYMCVLFLQLSPDLIFFLLKLTHVSSEMPRRYPFYSSSSASACLSSGGKKTSGTKRYTDWGMCIDVF